MLRRLGLPAVISIVFLLLLIFVSAAAPMVAPQDPAFQDLNSRFLPPLSPGHLLGTDSLGRDVLSRLLYGGRAALTVGIVSVSIALILGAASAVLARAGGRIVDGGVSILMDGILAIPTVLTALAVVSVFGYGMVPVMIAMGIVFSPLIGRLLRAELGRAASMDYVEAEILLNTPPVERFVSVILPQIVPPLAVQATSLFAASITLEASLSYLGIGVQPPNASWGLMLNNAKDYLLNDPWLAIPPGIALVLTVYSINTLGDVAGKLRRN